MYFVSLSHVWLIKCQNSFLYTNNEIPETEIRKKVPFDIATRKIKYLGINLTKEVKLRYIYTMEYYAAERKKELLPFVTAWMELESIMLSEISQAVKDKYHMILPIREPNQQNKQASKI